MGVDIHRIRAHKECVALRSIVAYKRRIACYEDIARLLPILAPIAKEKQLLRSIVNLDIAFEKHIVAIAIVIERVAEHLLLLGQNVAVASKFVELSALIERSSVGI